MSFPAEGDSIHRDKRAYLDEFRSLLVDATRIRLRADVPVGAYLSGGLDSSTTAAIIRNYTSNHLDTFSISFSDPEFDESEYQKQMARFLGTDHQVVYASHADIGHIFPEVIWHTETPIMRTSPAPMFLLSRLVRDRNFKVVLTGEGADEVLAGYDIFKEAKVRRFWARQPDSKLRPAMFKKIYPGSPDWPLATRPTWQPSSGSASAIRKPPTIRTVSAGAPPAARSASSVKIPLRRSAQPLKRAMPLQAIPRISSAGTLCIKPSTWR